MCKLSLKMDTKEAGAEGARPLCGGGRRPPSIISDSLPIPGFEKLTAGYFWLTVGIFWLSAVSQSARAASLRLLFHLFSGYLPRLRLQVFFCYLWAISGFLRNCMAVVGSGHHMPKTMMFAHFFAKRKRTRNRTSCSCFFSGQNCTPPMFQVLFLYVLHLF